MRPLHFWVDFREICHFDFFDVTSCLFFTSWLTTSVSLRKISLSQPSNLPKWPHSIRNCTANTMTTQEEWTTYFYTDISAQLRRHGVNQKLFDGLYLSKSSIIGSWLLVELVNFPKQLHMSWPVLESSDRISSTTSMPAKGMQCSWLLYQVVSRLRRGSWRGITNTARQVGHDAGVTVRIFAELLDP